MNKTINKIANLESKIEYQQAEIDRLNNNNIALQRENRTLEDQIIKSESRITNLLHGIELLLRFLNSSNFLK